ncbi:hypothetical protein BDB00DRAFT_751136, partial [Zychaea mexicana]|uniref:uncharacterized protein n=1 Tax=Zychaea mexicana TaxID=64656 RepID=UPI0022FED7E9
INLNNFMFPIRKSKNIEFTDKELLYNDTFGSFRSKIESCFGNLGNKFKRFNNNEGSIKVTDLKVYNLQLKLNHILWINENFDYPNPLKNDCINNIFYEFDLLRITDMTNQQDEFLNNYFFDSNSNNININSMDIENDSELDEDSFEVEKIIKHRKFKKRMKFYVKWKDYDETFNDWVWQEDFNDEAIIDEYL